MILITLSKLNTGFDSKNITVIGLKINEFHFSFHLYWANNVILINRHKKYIQKQWEKD